MYNNKRNVPSWPFLFSVIVSDVSDLNKSFPSCPWASPSIWLYIEVINLLSWEQLWHHRWSVNFTTGQNKWMWWPARTENFCLNQKPSLSESWPGARYPQSLQCDPSRVVGTEQTLPCSRDPLLELVVSVDRTWHRRKEALSAGLQDWKTKEERE